MVKIIVEPDEETQKDLRKEPVPYDDGYEDDILQELPDVRDVGDDLLDDHYGWNTVFCVFSNAVGTVFVTCDISFGFKVNWLPDLRCWNLLYAGWNLKKIVVALDDDAVCLRDWFEPFGYIEYIILQINYSKIHGNVWNPRWRNLEM